MRAEGVYYSRCERWALCALLLRAPAAATAAAAALLLLLWRRLLYAPVAVLLSTSVIPWTVPTLLVYGCVSTEWARSVTENVKMVCTFELTTLRVQARRMITRVKFLLVRARRMITRVKLAPMLT